MYKLNRYFIPAFTFFLLTTNQAMSQSAPVSSDNPDAPAEISLDSAGVWTPTAVFDAVELPLPEATLESLEAAQLEANDEPAEEMTEANVEGGNPNTGQIAPDLEAMIFDGSKPLVSEVVPTSTVIPEAVGTSGAHYSSSRLVPTSARTSYPYRINGKLFFKKQDGRSFICSGTVLRPRLILTAGHCVHKGSGGSNGFYRSVVFVPAYHQGQAPYQSWNYRWMITTGSWATSNGSVPNRADLAIIEVEDRRFNGQTKRIGDVVGWAGYQTNSLEKNHTKKIGYPGNLDSGQIMHQVDSGAWRKGGQNTMLYGSDMRGGSSGGGWFQNFGRVAAGQSGASNAGQNRLVGVTSYGYVSTGPKVQGSSILGNEFTQILQLACNHKPGNC